MTSVDPRTPYGRCSLQRSTGPFAKSLTTPSREWHVNSGHCSFCYCNTLPIFFVYIKSYRCLYSFQHEPQTLIHLPL